MPAPALAPAPDQLSLTPLQLLIKDTLNIPDHLTTIFKGGDIRMAYTRYLAVGDAKRRLTKLRAEGTWTQKLPTLEEFAGVFFGKTTYFNHSRSFAKVPNFPLVEKWLLGEEDAPSDSRLWGSKKPTYAKLEELVGLTEKKGKSKNKNKKGKKYQDVSSSSEASVKKGKDKKKGEGSKKGSSSKNRM
jgi:hypothetical protein